MTILTIENLPSKNFTVLKVVQGSTVLVKHPGKSFMNGFKTTINDEIKYYNEMFNDARKSAINQMILEAEQIGADAIVGVKYSAEQMMNGITEIFVYGTAIKYN